MVGVSSKPKIRNRDIGRGRRFVQSVWLFPVLLLVPLFVLTGLKLSGTSIGAYYQLLYGTAPDKSLVANNPESIRSDEWLVNTQQTIAQAKNNFARVNKNIGSGEDMSIIDAPYKDWSIAFKPHNLVFFLLPLDNAFAFKWWVMGYLLIISCYLFIVTLLPGKRLLAAGLSLALFFSAFVQWWYAYGTLGSLYYSFFIATAAIHLSRQTELRKKLLWGALIAYLTACFALVLYPPFQVACGLVLFAFLLGYALENYADWGRRTLFRNMGVMIAAGVMGSVIFGAFLLTRIDVVKSIQNTAYPGGRADTSGGFFPEHFLASQLGHQFESDKKTAQYLIDNKKGHTNQSEAANFLLLEPFLLIPSFLLLYYERRSKIPLDWPLFVLNILFIVFLLHLFVPAFTPIAHLLGLGQVADGRALIGIGLLNLMVIVLLVRNLSSKKFSFPRSAVALYCLLVLVVELLVDFHAYQHFNMFIGEKRFILVSLPLPIITYLLLTKRFVWAVAGYLAFSIYSSAGVNPLYRGLETITANPLSVAIRQVGVHSSKRWVSDGGYLENLAIANGQRSLSTVYNYPQFALWDKIPTPGNYIYNRYAHVGIQVSDNPQQPTTLKLIGTDSFVVATNSCSDYLRQMDVGFVITTAALHSPCLKLDRTVSFPLTTVYIYDLQSAATNSPAS